MANIKASKKNIRQIIKRTAHNRAIKSKIKTLYKNLLGAVKKDDKQKIKQAAIAYISSLDKAVKVKIIHRNKANRKKIACATYLTVT
jgi:small subunit ribosomal protein S20